MRFSLMTNKTAYLFEITDSVNRIRKMGFDNDMTDASIFEWGGLLPQSGNVFIIFPLPDFTLQNLGRLSLPSTYNSSIIKNHRVLVSGEDNTSIYSNDHSNINLYPENSPLIEEPAIRSLLGKVEP